MEAKDKLVAITAERDGLRNEIVSHSQSLQHCVFAGIAASAVLIGIYWQGGVSSEKDSRALLLVLSSQLIFGLEAFGLMLLGSINGIVAYTCALESKINSLADDTITVWESSVCPKYIWSRTCPATWCSVIFNLWLLGLFILSFVLALREITNVLFIVLASAEVLCIIGLFVWTMAHATRAKRDILSELKCSAPSAEKASSAEEAPTHDNSSSVM